METNGLEFKLCDLESACKLGDVFPHAKYTKAWVSPEVYRCQDELIADLSIDIFSLGLIIALVFDDHCHPEKKMLPDDNEDDFNRALTDQTFLDSLLPCRNSPLFSPYVRKMCSIDPSDRYSSSELLQNLDKNSRTELHFSGLKKDQRIEELQTDKTFL